MFCVLLLLLFLPSEATYLLNIWTNLIFILHIRVKNPLLKIQSNLLDKIRSNLFSTLKYITEAKWGCRFMLTLRHNNKHPFALVQANLEY